MNQRKRLINVYIYLFLPVGRGSAVLLERILVASDNEINRENCTFIERTWEFYPFCKIPVLLFLDANLPKGRGRQKSQAVSKCRNRGDFQKFQ